jgi:hypothetical protein
MGAEIKNAWEDRDSGNWYAAAVMEKAVCRDLYAAELDKAVDEIDALLDISRGISFETIAKCRRAQGILEKAAEYARILSILDGPNRQPELSGIGFTVAGVLAEAKAIPVNVRIQGDVDARFAAAFAGVFTAAGFRTGNRNVRFALEGAVSMAPAPRNQYFNTRYTIDAVLRDTRNGTELFTYHAAGRESHSVSQADADYRAAIGAERKIKEEFPKALQAYLDLH